MDPKYYLPPEMEFEFINSPLGSSFDGTPIYEVTWNKEFAGTIYNYPNNREAFSYNYYMQFSNEEVSNPYADLQQLIEYMTRYFRDTLFYSLTPEAPC